ncbi:MAG: ABC transporter permease [Anaerolineaceae bacterium]|nr:ABC transporter permease [Anaerolineaceae bacterium]
MWQYIFRRIFISFPILIGVTIVIFALIHFAPGDPVTGMIDPINGNMDSKSIQLERERLGLDKPVPVQYFYWISRVAKGDLGYSLINGKPVAEMIGDRFWSTVRLTVLSLLVSVIFGITIGIISAIKQYSIIDYSFTFLSFAAVSVPGFFMALGMIFLFALKLGWLPTSGMLTLGDEVTLWDQVKHLIMPVSVLGIGSAAPITRYARSSMLEVLNLDYINVARSKGMREYKVILRHAFPNALIPLLTVIGLRVPFLFGGSVIIEQIFHWYGMGSLNIWAVMNQDYTTLMGLNLISAILVLLSNLIVDISYAFVDPRIQYN